MSASTPPLHSFLRGAIEHTVNDETDASPQRELDESTDEKPFTIMLTVLVAFILMFFVVCTYQVMRIVLCKCLCGRDVRPTVIDPIRTDDTMLVHEGRVFNLTGHQRRAVLEAIFSERSKAVTDQDVADEKRKNKKRKKRVAADTEDEKMPMDAVEIPGVSTVGTDVSSGNHQNLSPTDSFGDVEIATSSYDNADYNDPPTPPMSRSTLAVDDLDDHSNLTYEHVYQDSGSVSDFEDEILPNTELHLTSIEGVESMDRSHVDTGSPEVVEHEVDEDDKRSSSPTIDRYGELVSNGSDSLGGGPSASFEGIWGEPPTMSFSFGPLGLQGGDGAEGDTIMLVESTSLPISDDDDDGKDDADVDACRRALFRNESDALPTAGSNTSGGGVEECKDDVNDDNEIPALEQVPSADSFGNFCEYITPSNLHIPVPMTKRESFATIASEYTFDDDSTTGDNVCPICLCGYKKGDMLVVSHHCTHCFHKDCILEWLDKHDECPICRKNMVTNSELNRAATSLVGKTRMYRAVASLQSSSPGNMRYRTQQSSPSSVMNGPSPLGGTVRSRSAAAGAVRTPPRGYQNPMAFS